MSCEFAHHDGAYVLGALSPADRLEFERHLPGCADCTRSVRELAGIPGLLARVTPEVLDSAAPDEPLPETLLPRLVREVRRTERRRVWVTTGVAAAAAVLATLGTLTVSGLGDDDDRPIAGPSSVTPTPGPTPGLDMEAVGPEWATAQLAMTGVAWGTRLDLTCTYNAPEGQWEQKPTYALFVRTREGEVEQVATWRALPGKTMQLAAATATSRNDIASVEVRTADGTRVLKLVA